MNQYANNLGHEGWDVAEGAPTTTAADRLHVLYDVNRRLAAFTDLDELLLYATQRTREVFAAEGCGLLLVERQRNEFYFPVASQAAASPASAARLAEIRFPADKGIAGWVLANDETIFVEDTSKDLRFYSGVDHKSQAATHSLLCAPLRSQSGHIGVVEVINPSSTSRGREDLELLETLATDIALAYEKAALYEQLRSEVTSLRWASTAIGYGLFGAGLAVCVGTVLAHVAWAQPLSELPTRVGLWIGTATMLAGGGLVAVARGWLKRGTRHGPPLPAKAVQRATAYSPA